MKNKKKGVLPLKGVLPPKVKWPIPLDPILWFQIITRTLLTVKAGYYGKIRMTHMNGLLLSGLHHNYKNK
jgi:hypothetical protein